jgi:hypothetical protein
MPSYLSSAADITASPGRHAQPTEDWPVASRVAGRCGRSSARAAVGQSWSAHFRTAIEDARDYVGLLHVLADEQFSAMEIDSRF